MINSINAFNELFAPNFVINSSKMERKNKEHVNNENIDRLYYFKYERYECKSSK